MSKVINFKKTKDETKPFKMEEYTFFNWVKQHKEDMIHLLEELTDGFDEDTKATMYERLDSICDNADYYDSLFNFSPERMKKYMEMNDYTD